MDINEIEKYYLRVIDENQSELIEELNRKGCCAIRISKGDSARQVYFYQEDASVCLFREMNMFYLFLTDLQLNDWNKEEWKPYAFKALCYLRMLPADIQTQNWEAYHYAVSNLYRNMGNERKSKSHFRQAFAYRDPEEIDAAWGKMLLQSMETPKSQLGLCLYVLSFITDQGIWGMRDYFDYWDREHYQWIEDALKMDLTHCADNQEDKETIRLLSLCLNGFYFKRTRRFKWAEEFLLKALDLAKIKETAFSPLMICFQLMENSILMGDGEKAQLYMSNAAGYHCWDSELLELLDWDGCGNFLKGDNLDAVNNAYANLFADICRADIDFSPYIKGNIDAFFRGIPEIDDDDEEEEEE